MDGRDCGLYQGSKNTQQTLVLQRAQEGPTQSAGPDQHKQRTWYVHLHVDDVHVAISALCVVPLLSGKHGVACEDCLELVQYIREECSHLNFAGLMTIGKMNHQADVSGPNPDFVVCVKQ